MPWNGNAPNKTFARSDGTRTGTQVWQQAEADGVDIVSNDHDTHDQDLAAGINAAVLRDGGNTALADLPMGNYRHTGVGDAARLNQYQTLNQALTNGGLYVPSANVGGTGNAITLTTTYNVATLAAGHKFAFVVAANNTDAAAVVIDGLASVAITRPEDGSDLEPGDLYEGAIAVIQHDGTSFQLLNRHMVDGGGGDTQTGAEIVSAINAELGSDNWQESAVAPTLPVEFADVDARVTVIGQTNEYAGGGCGEYTVRVTADGRIVVCGDTGGLGLDAAGDNYGGFELEWDRLNNGTITAVYCGSDYLLVQTDQTVGNLWSVGINTTYGVLGHGNTTSLKTLTRIAYFKTTNPVKISKVWTEAGTATAADRFWFAIDTNGNLYSCGSGTNYTQGGNSTSNVTTPRPVTQSDGTTQLTSVAEVSCCSVHAPVMARTSAGTLWRWGSGTSGAAGQGAATDMTWPSLLGGGTPVTGITKAVVSGASLAAARAVAAIIQDGVVKISGDRNYGNGDGTTSATPITAFTTVAGALAAITAVDLAAGDGDLPVLGVIDARGDIWFAGYGAANIYGAGAATSANNTFTKPTLPSTAASTVTISNASPAVIAWSGHRHKNGDKVHFTTSGGLPSGLTENTTYYVINASINEGTFQVSASVDGVAINTSTAGSGTHTGRVNFQKVRIAGFSSAPTLYAEANDVIYGIGYDAYYQTAQNAAGSTASGRTWQRLQGLAFPASAWYAVGPTFTNGLHVLCNNGHSRYVGYNAQGQGGVQPSNLHAVVTLQPMQSAGPRLLKPPTLVGAYSAALAYSYNDEVTQQGGSWRYIYATATTGNAPPTLPTTSNTYWRLAAAPGDDGVSLNWQGAWQTATSYAVQDGVENDGSSYICTSVHTSGAGTEPGTGASWGTVWDLAAAAGGAGPANTLSVDTVTTGAAGSDAEVTIDGVAPNQTISFVIPRGDTGADSTVAGPAAWLPVAAWADATAYVTGPPASVVTYNDETYVCTTAHTSSGTLDGSKFTKVAAKGTNGTGTGDVVGPAAATNNSLARFDGTTGKLLKDGAVIGSDVQAYSSVLAATTASFLTAHETKLGHISVTQAVDLDAIETRVAELDASVILKGNWDASAGTFPGSGSAQAGWSYIVSVAGTVDSIACAVNDRVIAITDNASTSTYAANWIKADYTDQVLSVAGRTGAVTLSTSDISGLGTAATLTTAQATAEVIVIPVSDEATAITTGTAKVTFRMPFAMTLTAVRGSLTEASSSGTPTIDINEAGSTILSTKLTIDASEKTSATAATAAVISDTSLADDAEITIDIDTAGTGAKGLKVSLIGYRT